MNSVPIYRQRSKNLRLIVEEETNELNEAITQPTPPILPMSPKQRSSQTMHRKSTIKERKSTLKSRNTLNSLNSDILLQRSTSRHTMILQAEDSDDEQKKQKSEEQQEQVSGTTSPRSSEISSDPTSPRSSDLSSDDEEQLAQQRQSVGRFIKKQSSSFNRPTAYNFQFSLKVPSQDGIDGESYHEEYEISRRISTKDSNLKHFFKKKSQGYVIYTVDTQSDETNTRSRTNTALLMRKRSVHPQQPNTPNVMRKHRFSPLTSPRQNLVGDPLQLPVQDFLQKAQQRARMLKLLPQDLEAILAKNSSDEDTKEKMKKRSVKMQLENAMLQREQMNREFQNKLQSKEEPEVIIKKEDHSEKKLSLNSMLDSIQLVEVKEKNSYIQRRPQIELDDSTKDGCTKPHSKQSIFTKFSPYLREKDSLQAKLNPLCLSLAGLLFLIIIFFLALLMVKMKN